MVSLFLKKEAYKFSAAHMTVFPNGTKEALHGHNYEVELTLTLKDPSFEKTKAFSVYKEILKKISSSWDEKCLLAKRNPYFSANEIKGSLEFTLCQKRYVLPVDEVVLLDCDNVTTENLSQLYLREFVSKLDSSAKENLKSVQIRISEYRDQGSYAVQEFG